MENELGKLSDNNLISLHNYLMLIDLEKSLSSKKEFYEYGNNNALFSLCYPIHKASNLMNAVQTSPLSEVEWDHRFNHDDAACFIENDMMLSLSRNEIINIIRDEIVDLLVQFYPNIDKQIDLYKAMSYISKIADNDSLLNDVIYLV